MRYNVKPHHITDDHVREPVAAFNSLALATQWAKNSAELEGRGWRYIVCEGRSVVAIYHPDGTIDTPRGIALS